MPVTSPAPDSQPLSHYLLVHQPARMRQCWSATCPEHKCAPVPFLSLTDDARTQATCCRIHWCVLSLSLSPTISISIHLLQLEIKQWLVYVLQIEKQHINFLSLSIRKTSSKYILPQGNSSNSCSHSHSPFQPFQLFFASSPFSSSFPFLIFFILLLSLFFQTK